MRLDLIQDEKNRYCDNRNIYIKDYNLLLFKIPKVAGTSMWQVAANLLNHKIRTESQTRQFRLPEISSLDLGDFPHVYKVAFIRNPWDRLLSCYLEKHGKSGIFFFQRNKLSPNMSFEEFVKAVCAIPDHESDRHFRSQYTFVTNHEGEILPDFIGEFSSFQQDFTSVLEKLEVPPISIPHWNKTNHRDYATYYTADLARAVALRYAIDIELFGYEFGKPTRSDFYTYWQRSMNDSIKLEIRKYKANKLLRNLKILQENTISPPKNLRQRIRILLKGK